MTVMTEAAPTAIRPATEADIPRLVAMGERFISETAYRDRITNSPDAMWTLAERLLGGGEDATILVAERDGAVIGMIGLVAFAHHISGERFVGEVCWWVDPEARGSAGVRLLKAAEQWARERGAVALQMIAPTEHVAGIYQALGYTPVETTFQKGL